MGTNKLAGVPPPVPPGGVEQAGLEADFDAFVSARGAALVRMARRLLHDPHDAEDVVQDVLVKAHQHWTRIVTRDSPRRRLGRPACRGRLGSGARRLRLAGHGAG